jgi:hypothetical protein
MTNLETIIEAQRHANAIFARYAEQAARLNATLAPMIRALDGWQAAMRRLGLTVKEETDER